MKILEGMVLTELGDDYVAVPTGEAAEVVHGIIRLNNTGTDIFKALSDGKTVDETVSMILDNYIGVSPEQARKATLRIIEELRTLGLLSE